MVRAFLTAGPKLRFNSRIHLELSHATHNMHADNCLSPVRYEWAEITDER
jgi:hypothetical protein